MGNRIIKSALISVFHKDRIDEIAKLLNEQGVTIYSTGGTYDFIKDLGIEAVAVEDVTSYPSILGGRVKTLHPKVFGGILHRRENEQDLEQIKQYEIPAIDLVIVDLYPFEKTVASTEDEATIIEKIDIGGISLIRGAAKNFKDVVIVPSANEYDDLINLLKEQKGNTTLEQRKEFAAKAFKVSSHYDTAIFNYFNRSFGIETFKQSIEESNVLRYGENPHQKGTFYGNLEEAFTQLHGKAISYNNLLDLDAGINLIKEFEEPTVAILKHNNACGLASRNTLKEAWVDALAGDPISAYGGVILVNREIDADTAEIINKLFFEIILAPGFDEKALEVLKTKKNRIILEKNSFDFPAKQFKSALNGVLEQDKDTKTETAENMEAVTNNKPSEEEISDLIFANKIVKHTKSNAIVLAKNKQLVGSGVGQTSRVDALKQAITKAKEFGFDLNGSVLASDAFFPFADSVELAHKEGVKSVVQPGGSVRDKDSIEYCNANEMAMVFTGTRHFKH